MRQKLLTLLLLILIVGLGWAAFARTVRSAPNTIPVTGADALFEPTLPTEIGFPSALRGLIDGLPQRLFLVRSSDGVLWTTLESLPATLAALMEVLPDAYFPVRSADATLWQVLTNPSATLNALLGQVPETYIPVRSADAVFWTPAFAYPSELTADNRPPIISNVQIEPITGLVEWQTDEFANSEANFGTQPGVYTEVITDTVWKIQHQLIPASGGWSYILFRAEDRSGNISEYYYPGYSIAGTALDNNGKPIAGAAVWVEPVAEMQHIQASGITLITLTGENGDYSLAGVPAGQYTISIHHPDFEFDGQSQLIDLSKDIVDIDFKGESTKFNLIYLPMTIK